MKYEVFASQLEAYLGQSPVRGGKAIKTDRKVFHNLNQLLSRVKSAFSRKANPEEKPTTPTTPKSLVSDPRLKAALSHLEKYLPTTSELSPLH